MEIISLVEKLGFPTAICLGGGYVLIQMVSKMFNRLVEDAKDDKELLKEELNYNRKIGSELLETNKLLAQDLSGKVEDLTEKIDDFIDSNKR